MEMKMMMMMMMMMVRVVFMGGNTKDAKNGYL
jgi:hypothetical protein